MRSKLAIIFWRIFPLGRQLAILGRQLDFCDLLSSLKMKISKFLLFLVLHGHQISALYDFPFLSYERFKMSFFPRFQLPT